MNVFDLFRRDDGHDRDARAVRCPGCDARPIFTHLDPPTDKIAYITCINPNCKAPLIISTDLTRPRSREEAIQEWNDAALEKASHPTGTSDAPLNRGNRLARGRRQR